MVCGSDFLSREAVGDMHLMPPKQRQSVEWGPGEVINWVHNTRRLHLEIQCQMQRNAADSNPSESTERGPQLRWESCGTIEPGAGERFRVNDGDVFKAIENGQVVDSWTADISRGVVHDIFVGGVPQHRTGKKISGKKKTRSGNKKKAKKSDTPKGRSVLDLL